MGVVSRVEAKSIGLLRILEFTLGDGMPLIPVPSVLGRVDYVDLHLRRLVCLGDLGR